MKQAFESFLGKVSPSQFVISCAIILSQITLISSGYATSPLDVRVLYQENRYLLGPGDVLNLQTADEPDYTQNNVLIGPDGHAHIVGVGDIDMKNKAIDEVSAEIKTHLQRILVDPQITLSLVKTKPCIVYLSGAMLHSGMFQINTSNTDVRTSVDSVVRTEMRLTNVLVNAGGVMPNADLSKVQVKRAGSGHMQTVDLWKVLKEGAQDQDPLINSGDSISIPSVDKMALDDEDYKLLLSSSLGPKTFPVRVVGEVEKPGIYNLDATSPLLNTAIVSAGGYAEQANRNLVAIRRFTDENKFSTFYVSQNKLDVVLRPNDVIFVPENKIYTSGRIGNQIARVLSPFQTLGAATSYSAQIFAFGGWSMNRFKQTSK